MESNLIFHPFYVFLSVIFVIGFSVFVYARKWSRAMQKHSFLTNDLEKIKMHDQDCEGPSREALQEKRFRTERSLVNEKVNLWISGVSVSSMAILFVVNFVFFGVKDYRLLNSLLIVSVAVIVGTFVLNLISVVVKQLVKTWNYDEHGREYIRIISISILFAMLFIAGFTMLSALVYPQGSEKQNDVYAIMAFGGVLVFFVNLLFRIGWSKVLKRLNDERPFREKQKQVFGEHAPADGRK